MESYMSRISSLVFLIVVVFGLSGCYTNLSKHLDREVHVRINGNLPVSVDNQGNSTFNEYMNDAQYLKNL